MSKLVAKQERERTRDGAQKEPKAKGQEFNMNLL